MTRQTNSCGKPHETSLTKKANPCCHKQGVSNFKHPLWNEPETSITKVPSQTIWATPKDCKKEPFYRKIHQKCLKNWIRSADLKNIWINTHTYKYTFCYNLITIIETFFTPHLDSSVSIRLQYLLSSMPVIANPFADIDKQTLPVPLSNQTFCINPNQ